MSRVSRRCHGVSRRVTVSPRCHAVSRPCRMVSRRCHEVSRRCHRGVNMVSRPCHGVSRRCRIDVTRCHRGVTPGVTRCPEVSTLDQHVDMLTSTGDAGVWHRNVRPKSAKNMSSCLFGVVVRSQPSPGLELRAQPPHPLTLPHRSSALLLLRAPRAGGRTLA